MEVHGPGPSLDVFLPVSQSPQRKNSHPALVVPMMTTQGLAATVSAW
jgi:hypothetical protein